mgnify:CR=1 FL=1
MIEIIQMLYAYTPIELKVVILACLIGVIYLHFKKDRNLDKEIKNCKNDKEIEEVIVKFYDK